MGFNTTILVLNDQLERIKNDPEFGRKLYEAILKAQGTRGEAIPVGEHGAWVVESHHADQIVPILVGGNKAIVISDVWANARFLKAPEDEVFQGLARKLGYKVTKKR